MDASQKLTQFIEAVTDSTEQEIAQVRQAAEQEAAALIAEAQARTGAQTAQSIAAAKTRLTAKYQKKLSQIGYRSQTALLSQRQTLLMQLFAELRGRLTDFAASEDYLPWLKTLLEKHPPEAGAAVLMREKDLPLAEQLSAGLPDSVTFRADAAIVLGGLSVLSADGRRCGNHTLDEAFASQLRNFYRNHKIDWGNE